MTVVFVAMTALVAAGSVARAQSTDPWIGTWKVNLAKSTYSPGPAPTAAGTITVEPSAGGMKTTITGTSPEGKPITTETVGGFDGKDNPVKGARFPNTTTAYKRIDGRTFEAMGKVDGKPTVTTRVVISDDGKTMTATQSGRNVEGQTVKNVIVAEKQ
jgi:hypothetical protein